MSALSFVAPLAGLGDTTDYTFETIDGVAGLFALSAGGIGSGHRIFVLDPHVYVPGYAPEISHDQREALGLEASEEAKVYVVANPAGGETAVNLLAPILVNPARNVGAQIILEDNRLPLRLVLAAA